jgi:peroxiredoxin (alkyl hydroperoxide reductase subunit C)
MENDTIIQTMPRIGDKAPDFNALTTAGPIQFSEYNKKNWVIMFSHPADFTPVCTTELCEFAKDKEWYKKHNTKLIGLSIDSVHSHLAWVNNVKENTGVYMDFPIIADLDMKVAKLYGMLHPGESSTAAVRAVFFIDPKGFIRLIMYYPLNVGRNMVEIKRVLVALQTADKHKMALPVNWEMGEKVIVPPPKTLLEMEERIANKDYEKVDFYLAKTSLN